MLNPNYELLLQKLLIFKQVMYCTYLLAVCLWQGFDQAFSVWPFIAWWAESSIVATVTMGIETCGEVNVMASTWPLCTKVRTLIFLIHNIYNHLHHTTPTSAHKQNNM